MSKRIDCTIILTTPTRVFRADFAGGAAKQLRQFAASDRPPESTLVQTIIDQTALSRLIGAKVLILDTAIWSQLISVPRLSVMDVETEELHNALKYEIETLTGVESNQSIIGAVEKPDPGADDATFWVNVATLDQFSELRSLLKAKNARRIGIAHPAGCSPDVGKPRSIHAEIWDGQVYSIKDNFLDNVSPASTNWAAVLGFESLKDFQAAGHSVFDVAESNDAAIKKWMAGVAAQLTGNQTTQLPFIEESSKKSSGWVSSTLLKLSVAAVIGFLSFVHWTWLHQQCTAMVQDTIALRVPATEKARYDAELTQVLERRSELERSSAAIQYQVKQVEFLIDHQTDRLVRLLALLRESRTSDLVIRQIEPNEAGLLVIGFSLDAKSVALMANRMRNEVTTLGWTILAPTQVGQKKMLNGGPWQFSIQFEDIGPDNRPSQVMANDPAARKPT